jgi:acetyl-CoA carboxylase biotin carboxyl carrier protein
MDLQKIKGLIDLLADSPLAELELIEGEETIRLVKAHRGERAAAPDDTGEQASRSVSAFAQAQELPPAGTASAHESHGAMPPPAAAAAESRLVGAPMSGVVHLTPAPGEAPFVNVGDTVAEGQVLCTIEAMKMFNALEAEFSGTVVEILVKPGDEVDAGQPLLRIAP